MKFAITGATGQLGRIVVDKLKAKLPPQDIVALVRDPAKAASLGIEAREADYGRPQTLRSALAGVDVLLLISSSEVGQRVTQHRNVVEAAVAVGVKRIVYTSLLHADTSPISLAREHRDTEAAIRASGIPFTILRNGWYMENHLGAAKAAVEHGALMGSAGEGRIAGAARADYAEAAVAVLTTPGHEGKVYELAGDEPYTLGDIAREIAQQSGKAIAYRDLPQAEYAKVLAGIGLPEHLAHGLAAWDVDASHGALFDDSRTLSSLIGRATTPLSSGVTRALG